MMTFFLLAALTPAEFQTIALAWLGALTVVAAAVGLFLPKLAPIFQQIETLFKKTDRQGERIDTQQSQIVDIAKSTPTQPPTIILQPQSAPTPVEIVDQPVKVKET